MPSPNSWRRRERVESFVAPLATFLLFVSKLCCNDRFRMAVYRVVFHSKLHFVNTKTLGRSRRTLPSKAKLVALVDSLRNGTLNEIQRDAVQALWEGILSLARKEIVKTHGF